MYTNRQNRGIVCFVFDLSIVIELYIISLFSITVLHNTFYIHVFYSVNFKFGIGQSLLPRAPRIPLSKSLNVSQVRPRNNTHWLTKKRSRRPGAAKKIYQHSTGITKLWKLRRQEFIRGWSQMNSQNSIFLFYEMSCFCILRNNISSEITRNES